MEQNNKCVMTEAMENKEIPLDINRVADMAPIDVKLSKMIDGVYYIFAGVMEILRSLEPKVAKKFLEEFTGENGTAAAPASSDIAATAESAEVEETQVASDKPETPKAPETPAAVKPAPSITVDDITKVIVAKIKQKRSNNEAIGALLQSYGVAKVSELPEAKYEAFITDLSQI